jgi:hypothetical protein
MVRQDYLFMMMLLMSLLFMMHWGGDTTSGTEM